MRKFTLLMVALMATLAAKAVCTGTSTEVDNFYTNADPTHAITSMTNGFTWTCETVGSNVNVTVVFNDALAGMANPQFFKFSSTGVLEGNPIPMNWDATTRTATYTVTGLATGDKLSFLVQVALEGGKVLFTSRVSYKYGDDCSGSGASAPTASCTGTSTEKDNHEYTSNGDFTQGYTWTFNTMSNGDVDFSLKYLDYFNGMASPQLFVFRPEGAGEVLVGNPIAMDWDGSTASHTFSGLTSADSIRCLVMIAYEAGGTLYTKRLTYHVGQDCSESTGLEAVEQNGMLNGKFFKAGKMYIRVNGQVYDAQGKIVK